MKKLFFYTGALMLAAGLVACGKKESEVSGQDEIIAGSDEYPIYLYKKTGSTGCWTK